jgi:hypothetical protein
MASWLVEHPGLAAGMALTSFASEANFAATSFGVAITFNIGWQVLYLMGVGDGSISTLALDMSCMEVFVSIVQAIVLRKWLCSRFALALSGPVCLGLYVGQKLMFVLDGPWLKRSMAAIMLAMAMHRVWSHSTRRLRSAPAGSTPGEAATSTAPPLDSGSSDIMVSLLLHASVAGLMGGLTTVAGPPLMLFVARHGHRLPFDQWRGAVTAMRLLTQLPRLLAYGQEGRFPREVSVELTGVMVSGGLLGLLCGNQMAPWFKNDTDLLFWYTLHLLAFGCTLLAVADSPVQGVVSAGVGMAALLSLAAATLRSMLRAVRRGGRRRGPEEGGIRRWHSCEDESSPASTTSRSRAPRPAVELEAASSSRSTPDAAVVEPRPRLGGQPGGITWGESR